MGRIRTTDRMTEALTAGGSAPVAEAAEPTTEQAAPRAYAEPVDALAALLDDTSTGNPTLSTRQRAMLVELDRARQTKLDYERKAKALGPVVTQLQDDLIALIPELDLDFEVPFGAEDDGRGYEIRPYMKRPVWPAYRTDDDTGQRYTLDQLIDTIYGTDAEHCVGVKLDHKAWQGYVRKRVEAWRNKCGGPAGDGVTNRDGAFVDHDGVPLSVEEAGDPVDDALALPRELRALIAPTEKLEIQFTRKPLASRAVAAMDATERAAEQDTAAG